MSQHVRIEGYAIVSADGMLADRNRKMPDGLKIDADVRFFNQGLDRATLVVHGRNSHEQQAGSDRRLRLIVTHRVAAVAKHPSIPLALLWNPAGASFTEACCAIGVTEGMTAVTGGAEVFHLFLEIGFDAFHLSRAGKVRIPDGRPVFPEVPALTPEQVLARHGLRPGPVEVLDAKAEATLVTWEPPPGGD
jgi:dihydrofolate reductase